MNLILPSVTFTTAIGALVYGPVSQIRDPSPANLSLVGNFVYGSSGTSVDAYVQTTLDGSNWFDIANFHFTTSSAFKGFNLSSLTPVTTQASLVAGSITANSAQDGIIGSLLRVGYKSSGTYAGSTTLTIAVRTGRLSQSPNE